MAHDVSASARRAVTMHMIGSVPSMLRILQLILCTGPIDIDESKYVAALALPADQMTRVGDRER